MIIRTINEFKKIHEAHTCWSCNGTGHDEGSSCCGAAPVSNGDSDTSDYGICSECGEHCDYDAECIVCRGRGEIDESKINEAVYREGYHCIDIIQQNSVQIYPDAADFGAPYNKGDKIYNATKQLVDTYKDKNIPIKNNKYSTGASSEATVTLIDEWAVSDGDKTVAEATEKYLVNCVTSKGGIKYNGQTYTGYVTVTKI